MAVPFSNTKLRVPKGFQNILEGLAREILRSQPENLFQFGAQYFERLLKVREETGHDPAVHGARLEDRFYNNDSFKSPSVDSGSPQQQDAALKIQTNYRKHVAEETVAAMREEEAAEKIQAGFRGFQDRQKYSEMKKRKSGELQRDEKKDEEEVDIDLNDPDVEAAAVKIQAGFKGFKARQEIKELKDKKGAPKSSEPIPTSKEEEIDINLNDPEVNAAAVKIQAGFKGHKTRQQLKEKKDKKGAPKSPEPSPTSKEEEIDIDLNDPEVNAAALKIQAGFKGHKTRQQLKEKKEKDSTVEAEKQSEPQAQEEKVEAEDDEEAKAQEENSELTKDSPVPQSDEAPKPQTESASEPESGIKENDEEVDIDLNDPEVAQAALKIQTGFRGHIARKEVQAMKESKQEKTKEEDVDIDLEDPEVEKAALKIQAGFKGMQARQEIRAMKEAKEEKDTEETKEEIDIDLKDPETEKAALKIQAGFKGYQTRKEIKARKDAQSKETNEDSEEKKEEIDIDLNDPEVEKAATKIQAGFKGFKTRQEIKAKKEAGTDSKEADDTEQTEEPGEEATEGEKIDIDLNDPEVAQAATKIQAGFKGYKTRQEIKARKAEEKKDGE